ncbi:MAG: DUF1501 domain-containing protein [Xanthomonadales bacterium]|nr:DUF1501 domain-containing protein [Xanthomonadales bacterium]MCB1640561.1 DUF1501 domain-containing protein [Xanthomonadales bacterium]
MNRRELLRKTLCATAGSAMFTALGGKLQLAHAAVKSGRVLDGVDYRALVCVFLYGGNDSFNMLVPRDTPHYNVYATGRGGLAIPQGDLLPLTSLNAASDGGLYGLHPSMAGLQGLFGSGRAALVSNVGPLLAPITKTQYQNGSVPVPAQLFSHSDQQVLWQTPQAATANRRGWGGRLADLFSSTNPNQQLSMNISLAGENIFQAGESVVPYFVSTDGAEGFNFVTQPWEQERRQTFLALRDASYAHPLQRQYASVVRRAMDNEVMVNAALSGAAPLTTAFPDTYLGRQLRMVARLISARGALQMQRQIFFVGVGGYDTHDNQLTDHTNLLAELSGGLQAFYSATVEMGLEDSITSFTASDFGRTLSINGDGTDHGWGGHQIVVGGAVRGQRYYGQFPNLTVEGPDDAGWGQIIPTTSVDQYAATLARWYGLPDSDRSMVFPNLGNFATPDLGFMNPPV